MQLGKGQNSRSGSATFNQ
jgi:hypothetical protein